MASNDRKRTLWKVGFKFCGGCNPDYDRVALANRIAKGLKGKVKVVSLEQEDVGFVIAVEGCSTACADLSPFSDLPIYTIFSEEQGEQFIDRVVKGLFP